MTGFEPFLFSALYHLAKRAAEGVIETNIDRGLRWGLSRAWREIRSRSIGDPVADDLQRAARRAYLRACWELADQAGLPRVAKQIRKDVGGVDRAEIQTSLGELDALPADSDEANDERMARFHAGLYEELARDLDRWGLLPWSDERKRIERPARDGWELDGKRRDLPGVMALWFWDEIKNNEPARNIFQTQMLAEAARREPALAKLADPVEFKRLIESFGDRLGGIETTLDRMDAKLDELPEKVADEIERRRPARDDGKPFARLDARPVGFVERPEHLEWLEQRLFAGAGPTLLSGGPGSGKSTLALEFGWRVFEQGRFSTVVQQFCGPERGRDQVGVDLAAVLPGIDLKAEPRVQIERAREWLRKREALLILDDVWDESVMELAPGGNARVLYTSRKPLLPGLVTEQVRRVEGFRDAEAEELFEKRLDGWAAEHGEVLRALAVSVERLPYALDVAAGLLKKDLRPPAERLAWVRERALVGKAELYREAVAAHTEEARRLLACVALCAPEGVWLPFAAEMAALEGEALWQAAAELAETSLLRRVETREQVFGVHALLRGVLAERAREFEEARVRTLGRLLEEWNRDRTRWRDAARVLAEAEAAAESLSADEDLKRYSRIWTNAVELAWRTGELPVAYRLLERQQTVYSESQDRNRLQASYGNQALILQVWGRLDEALALLKKQEAICEELGNRASLAISLANQGQVLREMVTSRGGQAEPRTSPGDLHRVAHAARAGRRPRPARRDGVRRDSPGARAGCAPPVKIEPVAVSARRRESRE